MVTAADVSRAREQIDGDTPALGSDERQEGEVGVLLYAIACEYAIKANAQTDSHRAAILAFAYGTSLGYQAAQVEQHRKVGEQVEAPDA